MNRIPGMDEGLLREARHLASLATLSPSVASAAPQVLAVQRVGRWTVLLESVIHGKALDRVEVLRDPAAAVQLALTWAEKMPTVRGTTLDRDPIDRILLAPLRRLREWSGGDAEISLLVDRTEELLGPLERAGLPLVLEHGDLSHPNLIVGEDGMLGVVDWELSRLEGMPLHDLVLFLGFVATAHARSASNAVAAAFEDTFLRDGSPGRDALVSYADARAIPRRFIGRLIVAAWARRTVMFSELLAPAPRADDDGGSDLAAAAKSSAFFGYWRHAVDRIGEMDAAFSDRSGV